MDLTKACFATVDELTENVDAATVVDSIHRGMQVLVPFMDWRRIRRFIVRQQGFYQEKADDPATPDYGVGGFLEGVRLCGIAIAKHDETYAPTPHGETDTLQEERDIVFAQSLRLQREGRSNAGELGFVDAVDQWIEELSIGVAAMDTKVMCQMVGSGMIGSTNRTFKKD
jgi:hypothetical protein